MGGNIFTAPAGTTLSADTTYAVVVTAGTTSSTVGFGVTTTDLNLEVTTSNGENERSASRWSIFDAFDIESGSSWSADTGGKALYIAVRGAPVPDKPTGLSATPSGSDRINLSWTAPSMDGGSAITGYRIEVSTDGSTGWTDLVADTGSTTTTYSHTGLSVGDTRHYRVSAININGTGPASDTDHGHHRQYRHRRTRHYGRQCVPGAGGIDRQQGDNCGRGRAAGGIDVHLAVGAG